jgi:hypothetical protein
MGKIAGVLAALANTTGWFNNGLKLGIPIIN